MNYLFSFFLFLFSIVNISYADTTSSFSDNFSTDTTSGYTVELLHNDAGTFTYDSVNQHARVLTPRTNSLQFSRDLAVSTEGSFSIDFLPVQTYGYGGKIILRLSQDDNNYYEIYNTDGYGPGHIVKVVNGIEVDNISFTSEYSQNINYSIIVSFTPFATTVQAFGESLTMNSDTTAVAVSSFSVWSAQQDSFYDNIVYTTSSSIPLRLVSPLTGHIQTGSTIIAKATAVNLESGWGVKFILDDEDTVIIDNTEPYEADFGSLSRGEHSIDAYIVDGSGKVQSGAENHDSVDHIGTGGDILVAMGDSITEGYADDDPSDDISADGRNIGGGYEPILNDLLTSEKGYPHSIINEGVGSEVSAGGLSRLQAVLDKHPEATTYLLMYGTNDARTDLNVDPEVFRDNMQQMIDKIKTTGKMPLLAKIPRVLGECTACIPYYQKNPIVDPEDGARNVNIREYNVVIDELATANSIAITPPEFYTYFKDTYGDTYSSTEQDGYADNLHPDGLGYKEMAELWSGML